jgi:hypothetical protein
MIVPPLANDLRPNTAPEERDVAKHVGTSRHRPTPSRLDSVASSPHVFHRFDVLLHSCF